MASGNQVSEHVLGHDGNKGELERLVFDRTVSKALVIRG
jgi:hypothetical protein